MEKGVWMKHIYFAVLVAAVLLLGCTLLPPPKEKPNTGQGGNGGSNESAEVLQAKERAMAAYKEVLQKRNAVTYKATYAVNDAEYAASEVMIFSSPPTAERVDKKLRNKSTQMTLDDTSGSYRCEITDIESICYKMPLGSAREAKPVALKEEANAAKFPEVYSVMQAGAAPSSIGELAASCFTLASIGTKTVVCYTQTGVPSYVKMEQAGLVREVLMKSSSPAADSDFDPPAQMTQTPQTR